MRNRSHRKPSHSIWLLFFSAFLLAVWCRPYAWAGELTVRAIFSGDALSVQSPETGVMDLVLYGIDSPTLKQPQGVEARSFLEKLLAEGQLEMDSYEKDEHGRQRVVLRAGGKVVNEEMVRAGLAWVYDRGCMISPCHEWGRLENEAKRARQGLWVETSDPVSPWEWLRTHREEALDGPYHGNVDSKIFHHMGCQHYPCDKCTEAFQGRKDALDRGYTPCEICTP